jgi:hypothetical protein
MNGSYLINVTKHYLFDCVVLQDFANDATVATSDDQHFLGVRVTGQWEMRNHLLISVIDLIDLNDIHSNIQRITDENSSLSEH